MEDSTQQYIQLNENYRITVDKMNIILQEKYEKKDGKGKNAVGTGEYDYKDLGYFGSLDHLVKSLIKREVIKSISEVDSLEKVVTYIKDVERSIKKHLNEKVVIHN